MFKIPPEKRLNHQIHRQVIMSLSPELARITYNKTSLPASAPLVLWRYGKAYRRGRQMLKDLAWRASGGRIYIPNRTDYVDHAGWLRTNDSWKRYFRTLLLSSDSHSREYLDQSYIGYLIAEHEAGRINASYRIMRLVTFEIFLRRFLA
jgi:hypothetical protein